MIDPGIRRGAASGDPVAIPTPGAIAPPRPPGGLPASALAELYALQGPTEIPAGMMQGQVRPPEAEMVMRARDPVVAASVPANLFPGREYASPPPLQAPPASGRPVPAPQRAGAEMAGGLPQYTTSTEGLFEGAMTPAQRAMVDETMRRRTAPGVAAGGRVSAGSSPAFFGQQTAVGLPRANAQLPAMPVAGGLAVPQQQAQQTAPVRREPAPVVSSPRNLFGPRR